MDIFVYLYGFMFFFILLTSIYVGLSLYERVKHSNFLKALVLTLVISIIIGFASPALANTPDPLIITGITTYVALFLLDLLITKKKKEVKEEWCLDMI